MIADAEVAAKFAMCDDLASVLKPRLKIGAFLEGAIGGGGAVLDLGRPKVAAEQVRSVRFMVLECQLWARGEQGHDAAHLSRTIRLLSGVYVATPDGAEREGRLKVVEQAVAILSARHPGVEPPLAPLSGEERDELLATGAKLAGDADAMAVVMQGAEAVSLNGSTAATRLELWKIYSASRADAEDLQTIGGLISKSQSEIAALRERVGVLERPGAKTERVHVLFPTNAATLDEVAKQRLTNLAAMASNRSVRVIGYADSLGPPARNQKLSEARAAAVAAYLAEAGLTINETIGSGATTLFAGGPSSNRRAVIELLPAQ